MTERTTSERARPPATGVARGSIGTGSNVDDETKAYEVSEISWSPSGPPNVRTSSRMAAGGTPAPGPIAPAVVPDPAPVQPERVTAQPAAPSRAEPAATAPAPRQATTRRDPFRPIGIALAAVLVALAGVAVVSSGGDSPIDAGAPPAATEMPDDAEADGDDDNDGGAGPVGGNNGNGGNNGRGNGDGPGGNNGRGNDD